MHENRSGATVRRGYLKLVRVNNKQNISSSLFAIARIIWGVARIALSCAQTLSRVRQVVVFWSHPIYPIDRPKKKKQQPVDSVE